MAISIRKPSSRRKQRQVCSRTQALAIWVCTASCLLLETAVAFSLTLQATRTTTTSRSESTRLTMVADMPESVIEQVSTQKVLDSIIDESVRLSARRPIMMQFDPSSRAIWSHWRGTIFAETWPLGLYNVIWAFYVYFLFRQYPAIRVQLADFSSLWGQLLSVTTFTLTFFVNQSYSIWRSCLSTSRTLQGRLADLSMALSASAKRIDPTSRNGHASSQFLPASRQLLLLIARYVRLFNLFSYASFTRSHRPLLTPRGMRRMVERGILTPKERQVLISASIPATQRHNAILTWALRSILNGLKVGLLEGGPGFEQQIIAKVQEVRAQGNTMEGVLRGRMPFAYAHIVQVLVDITLWLYPVMMFSSGTSRLALGIFGTGLLTMCYQGLFDLAKQFLDPFYNESFWSGGDCITVETLIAETNSLSVRWIYGLEEMPVPYQSFLDGDFGSFMLPDQGYTVAQMAQQQEAEKERQVALESTRMSKQEYEVKVVELLEAAEQELEETKRILNAPPGADFVPGLDDAGESLAYRFGMEDATNGDTVQNNAAEQKFERYRDGIEEEREMIQDVMEKFDISAMVEGDAPPSAISDKK